MSYFCGNCNEPLPNNDLLIRHISTAHNGAKVFKCVDNACDRKYSNLKSFIKHRRSEHG